MNKYTETNLHPIPIEIYHRSDISRKGKKKINKLWKWDRDDTIYIYIYTVKMGGLFHVLWLIYKSSARREDAHQDAPFT